MSGSLTLVLVVSLLAFCFLHTVWAGDSASPDSPTKLPCPTPLCSDFCPNGLLTDSSGCLTCKCKPTTETTPPSNTSNTNTPAPVHFQPQPPCVDSLYNCAEYGFFHCNPDSLWARYICREHCGVCVQHCEYGGQWFSHGARWQDGCAYDCECVDGAIGHYQCYSKCPTYLFLPPHCTLVQLPGLCCLQPVCDFGAIYYTTSGQNVDYLNGYPVCVYNGKKYYQNQGWTVGCDMECFCYDAGIGLYTCHSMCAQYGMLSSNCRLVKKSGECCAKPECVFYTTMGAFIGVGQPSGDWQSVYTVFTF